MTWSTNTLKPRRIVGPWGTLTTLSATSSGRWADTTTPKPHSGGDARPGGTGASAAPVDDQDRNDLAGTQSDLGAVYDLIGKLDLAGSAHGRRLAIRDTLVREHPDNQSFARPSHLLTTTWEFTS